MRTINEYATHAPHGAEADVVDVRASGICGVSRVGWADRLRTNNLIFRLPGDQLGVIDTRARANGIDNLGVVIVELVFAGKFEGAQQVVGLIESFLVLKREAVVIALARHPEDGAPVAVVGVLVSRFWDKLRAEDRFAQVEAHHGAAPGQNHTTNTIGVECLQLILVWGQLVAPLLDRVITGTIGDYVLAWGYDN